MFFIVWGLDISLSCLPVLESYAYYLSKDFDAKKPSLGS